MSHRRKFSYHDGIDEYTPYQILAPRIAKEERCPCFCFIDKKHCAQFEDDNTLTLEAVPVLDRFEYDVYIRIERACGLIMWISASMWGIDTTASEYDFWWLIFRRAEKQCASLDNWNPQLPRTETKPKTKHRDRRRESAQRRSR